jgi:hypothetical protein
MVQRPPCMAPYAGGESSSREVLSMRSHRIQALERILSTQFSLCLIQAHFDHIHFISAKHSYHHLIPITGCSHSNSTTPHVPNVIVELPSANPKAKSIICQNTPAANDLGILTPASPFSTNLTQVRPHCPVCPAPLV